MKLKEIIKFNKTHINDERIIYETHKCWTINNILIMSILFLFTVISRNKSISLYTFIFFLIIFSLNVISVYLYFNKDEQKTKKYYKLNYSIGISTFCFFLLLSIYGYLFNNSFYSTPYILCVVFSCINILVLKKFKNILPIYETNSEFKLKLINIVISYSIPLIITIFMQFVNTSFKISVTKDTLITISLIFLILMIINISIAFKNKKE